jgi:hypothetical protein
VSLLSFLITLMERESMSRSTVPVRLMRFPVAGLQAASIRAAATPRRCTFFIVFCHLVIFLRCKGKQKTIHPPQNAEFIFLCAALFTFFGIPMQR